METYEIEVATGGLSVTYTVALQEDGTYLITHGKDRLGQIYPEVLGNGVIWYTDDDIDEQLLKAIGEAIEVQEM